MAAPPNLAVDPSAPPVVSPDDLTTLNILPSLQSPGAATLTREHAAQELTAISAQANPLPVAVTEASIGPAEAELANYAVASDQETANLATICSTAAYFAAPRITALSSQVLVENTQATVSLSLDLMRDSIFAIGAPGQNAQAPLALAGGRGIFDSLLESQALPSGAGIQSSSSAGIIQQSLQQDIPLAVVDASDLAVLQTFNLPPDAIAGLQPTSRMVSR